jgi:transcriptional regulator with XRE-family HTH domain
VSKRELVPDLEYQKAFGERVRNLREEVGWTQIDLSIHSQVSEYQISVIENGHVGANLQTIKSIAAALGKRPSELLDFKFPIKLNTNFPKKTKSQSGTTSNINKLVGENFFKHARSVKEVIDRCYEKFGVRQRSTDTSGALLQLVKKQVLKIAKSTDGKNLYQRVSPSK